MNLERGQDSVKTISELMNLEGRRALVTGASGHLGRVISSSLAQLGADLILIDHSNSDLELLGKELSKEWRIQTEIHYCDLEIQKDRSELIAKLLSSNSGLNIIVNNAAFTGSKDLEGWAVSFEKQSLDTWRRAIEVNLTAIFELCQGLSPVLKNSGGAAIVNIASIYGKYGPDLSLYDGTNMGNPAAYGVSKGGLIQLSRWLATVLAPEVRVNTISPGGIFRNQPEEFVKKYESKTPLNRMASEEDFVGVVAYLCSDLSKYVTGQDISVDGGWGIW